MLDIKFIRENSSKVQKAAAAKGVDVDIDATLEAYEIFNDAQTTIQLIRERRNKAAKEKNIEEGKKIKEELDKWEKILNSNRELYLKELLKIPNPAKDDVPFGKDETENVEIKKWGTPKNFDFTPKDHIEIGKLIDGIDTEKASEISGARFNYLKGDVVLLEFALIQFAFSVLTTEEILKKLADKIEKDYSCAPFIPVVPPVMIRPEIFEKMARLEPQDERYFIPKDNLFLIGSAEHTLGPLHMDETLNEKDLPIRYVGFSSAFRREAGSYGKDTKGILRVHQFDKIEMETFTMPKNSIKEQNFIVSIQEYLMQTLEIPYRVMMICTGDMSAPDARQIDIESWIPSQNKYRETHTSDLMTDYQSRRLNTRVRYKDGKTEYVHMNDATAFAIGRTIIAILENYQEKDGSIVVPKVLQKYIGKNSINSKKM